MTSSIVIPIPLFFLLLLVSPHMNEALGAKTELGKLGGLKTNHPDQVMMVQRIPRISIPRRFLASRCPPYKRCKRSPGPHPNSSKGTDGLGH
ncbi:hypothetical protein CARUB_v10010761mg [Capsella rubella]|uniref:Transmembrane protein n=1 Tax=Capsella rubella TaxID=81985 RepID=R0IJU1_9BRAS|nr:hypothetical protein CARUB_v10010761mg [Capsella rubella]